MTRNETLGNQDMLTPLIETIKELTKLISEEISLLQNSRPKETEELLPYKNRLMASYHKEMTELNNRGGIQASGNGPSVRLLKQESRLFQKVLEQHTRLVKALKKISEDMIKAVSEEVIKTQNQTSRYGANGMRSDNTSPTSITLNQKI